MEEEERKEREFEAARLDEEKRKADEAERENARIEAEQNAEKARLAAIKQ